MIDFRYHLVSIVAVFLALAIGIVLGSTELQGTTYNVLNRTTAKLQGEYDQTRGQLATAQAQANEGEAYAQAVEPAVLRDLLPGQRLLIITEPGASSAAVAGISAAAADADATVTGQIALQPKFFDTSATTQDSLNQTTLDLDRSVNITLNSTESYPQQAAQLMASEILVKSLPAQPTGSASDQPTSSSSSSSSDSNAQSILTAYASSGFLNTTGQPADQANLAVVVTPQAVPADGSADQLAQVLVQLASELAANSSATVVAGTQAGSGSGSPMAVLRSNNVSNQVSTVDDADLYSGQTAVIQALAIMLNGGKAASYGFAASGAGAVAPTPAPTPSASPSASASATTKPPAKKPAKKKAKK